jgi:hypothetical protein
MERIIPEALLKQVIDYIATGSVSTSKSWSEVRSMLLRLEQLITRQQEQAVAREEAKDAV